MPSEDNNSGMSPTGKHSGYSLRKTSGGGCARGANSERGRSKAISNVQHASGLFCEGVRRKKLHPCEIRKMAKNLRKNL